MFWEWEVVSLSLAGQHVNQGKPRGHWMSLPWETQTEKFGFVTCYVLALKSDSA